MNRNIMIQTLRRFKVTSGYKGYYYLLDAADIISGFHTKEKPFATQNDIYIPIGEKHETSFYNVERGIRVVVDKCWKEDKELMNILNAADLIVPDGIGTYDGDPWLPCDQVSK